MLAPKCPPRDLFGLIVFIVAIRSKLHLDPIPYKGGAVRDGKVLRREKPGILRRVYTLAHRSEKFEIVVRQLSEALADSLGQSDLSLIWQPHLDSPTRLL